MTTAVKSQSVGKPDWRLDIAPDPGHRDAYWVSLRRFGVEGRGEFTRRRRVLGESDLLSLLEELRPDRFGDTLAWNIAGDMVATVLTATEGRPEDVIRQIRVRLHGTLAIHSALSADPAEIRQTLDRWTVAPADPVS
jgi:hypothetical protein